MTAESRFLTRQPHPYTVSKGPVEIGGGAMLLNLDQSIWKLSAPGTPVDGAAGTGAGWAGIGSEYTDATAGKLYINTGTKASPTWTVVGSQS